MRKLDRSVVAAPASLTGAAASTEMANAVAHYAARVPWLAHHTAFKFKKYSNDEVNAALRSLSGGKCAYCETKIFASGAREVEHYRPKGRIRGIAGHPGYWWLAHDWDNLLPTCRDCNKRLFQHIIGPGMTRAEVEALISTKAGSTHGKHDQFEILGTRAVGDACCLVQEDALLIDPCRRDPANDIDWDFSGELTLVHAKVGAGVPSPYGAYTIRTCALNRAQLVLDRIPPLNLIKAAKIRIVDRLNRWAGSADELDDIMAEVDGLSAFAEPDQPYAGMAAAFIREFEAELDAWFASREAGAA